MRRLIYSACLITAVLIAFVVLHFPYTTDAEPSSAESAKTVAFHQQA